MSFKSRAIFLLILATAMIAAPTVSSGAWAAPLVVEDTRTVLGVSVRVQVIVSPELNEAAVRQAIDKAFKAVIADSTIASMGIHIDKIVNVLKSCGVKNAFVNSYDEMYALGQKDDKELWKAWIPHPTDTKKVFAMLRLKDNAIATVRNNAMSASVVAEDTSKAEKLAADLLIQGPGGLEIADKNGIDALVIIKDGKKFKTGMAGGFKEQYGKAAKK